MSGGIPYIGSKISLISRAEIRYEGFLFSIDANESTVALCNVKSYGSEDRLPDKIYPPKDEIFEYIVFKGPDIKDIKVCSEKPAALSQAGLPNDPAIVQISNNPSVSQQPVASSYQQPIAKPSFGPVGGMPSMVQPGPYHTYQTAMASGAVGHHHLGMPSSAVPLMPAALSTSSELSSYVSQQQQQSQDHQLQRHQVNSSPADSTATTSTNTTINNAQDSFSSGLPRSTSSTPTPGIILSRKSPTIDQSVQVSQASGGLSASTQDAYSKGEASYRGPANRRQPAGNYSTYSGRIGGDRTQPQQQQPIRYGRPAQMESYYQNSSGSRGGDYQGRQGDYQRRVDYQGRSQDYQPRMDYQRRRQDGYQQQWAESGGYGRGGGGMDAYRRQPLGQLNNGRMNAYNRGGGMGAGNPRWVGGDYPMHQQQRGGMEQRGGYGRGYHQRDGIPRGGRGGQGSKSGVQFGSEYDFEKANSEFEELSKGLEKAKIDDDAADVKVDECEEKTEKVADLAGMDSGNETGAGTETEQDDSSVKSGNAPVFYNKEKSFFDNISCEASERSKGKNQRPDWREERRINVETFGAPNFRRGVGRAGPQYKYAPRGGGYSGGYRANRYGSGGYNVGEYGSGGSGYGYGRAPGHWSGGNRYSSSSNMLEPEQAAVH